MKKKLSLVLLAIALVASLGFVSVANAPVASAKKAEVRGTGTLTAKGDGIAILNGEGVVDVSGNGILWVKDVAGNATIKVTGHGEKRLFADGWTQYAGFNGTAHVEGTKVIVVLAGVDVELSAQGRGWAILWGHGTYEKKGKTSPWSTRFWTQVKF